MKRLRESNEDLPQEQDEKLSWADLWQVSDQKNALDSRHLYWLIHEADSEGCSSILEIGRNHQAFKPFPHDDYGTLGELIFSQRDREIADEALAERLKMLFELWPFEIRLQDELKRFNRQRNESIAEIFYSFGSDIFATLIAKQMPKSLQIVLKQFSGMEKYKIRVRVRKMGGLPKVHILKLVEFALLAQSYPCLSILLQSGFPAHREFKLYKPFSGLIDVLYEDFGRVKKIAFNLDVSDEFNKLFASRLCWALRMKIAELERSHIPRWKKYLRETERKIRGNDFVDKNSIDLYVLSRKQVPFKAPLMYESFLSKKDLSSPKKYTYIEKAFYALPGDSKEMTINMLITKLLYRTARYSSLSLDTIKKINKKNRILIGVLHKLNPGFRNGPNNVEYQLDDYRKFIEKKEEEAHDFFADDLSEDSDDEQKRNYEILDDRLKLSMRKSAGQLIYQTNLRGIIKVSNNAEKLMDVLSRKKKGEDKGKLKLSEDGKPIFNQILALSPFERQKAFGVTEVSEMNIQKFPPLLKSRPNIVSEIELQKQDDLTTINYLMARGEFAKLQEWIQTRKIKTKFIIAQYRGVHHNIASWRASDRRKHRNTVEKRKPQFSAGIFQAFPEPGNDDEKRLSEAAKWAQKMQEFKNNSDPDIQSLFLGFQSLYTNYYDEFHQFLRYAFLPPLKKTVLERILRSDKKPRYSISDDKMLKYFLLIEDVIRRYLPNAGNPFVSTGDLPLHALKYAYGLKSYPGHKDERLRPRWKKDGRAERPYSGKFYVSAYSLEDYLRQPANHVLSMHNTGKIVALSTNKAERETSFFAYQPSEKIIYEHKAKYPSFDGDFHPLFEHKYGLSENMYKLFQKTFREAPPHSDENWNAKFLLGEILCAYQEALTLNFVNDYAVEQGAILIYRNRFGSFEFSPGNINLEADADPDAKKEPWTQAFKRFVEIRRNVFKDDPQKDLVDACLCGDLKRVEALLPRVNEISFQIPIPEYENDQKLYSPLEIANEQKNKILIKMLEARDSEIARENQMEMEMIEDEKLAGEAEINQGDEEGFLMTFRPK